jgi:MFS family permease
MFALINYFALGSVRELSGDLFRVSGTIENFLSCIFVVVFGFFADRFGRKKLVVFGFALLGMGYASLGLLQKTALQTFGWWFYTAVDGIAWGIFYAIFVMTIWGDLAQGRNAEKYYALGLIPFFASSLIEVFGNYLAAANVVQSFAIFSFASLFLFFAVLPLAYAPETLNLKEREFKNYVQKAMQTKVKQEKDGPV